MNKVELANKVFHEYELGGAYKKQVIPVVEATFDAIAEELANHGEISIVGFGKFCVETRKGRMGTDPRTQEPIYVNPVPCVKFHPSEKLKMSVRAYEE